MPRLFYLLIKESNYLKAQYLVQNLNFFEVENLKIIFKYRWKILVNNLFFILNNYIKLYKILFFLL